MKKLGKPFTAGSTLYAKWNSLYKRSLLEAADYLLSTEDLLAKLRAGWGTVLDKDLPMITRKIRESDLPFGSVSHLSQAPVKVSSIGEAAE